MELKTFSVLETQDWSCTLCLMSYRVQDNDGEILVMLTLDLVMTNWLKKLDFILEK